MGDEQDQGAKPGKDPPQGGGKPDAKPDGGKGAGKDEPKPPEPPSLLPLPKDFSDFLECRRDSVKLAGAGVATTKDGVTAGFADYGEKDPKKKKGHFKITFKGLKEKNFLDVPDPLDLDASIDKDGQLHIHVHDDPNVPKPLKKQIRDYVQAVNKLLGSKGKKFGPASSFGGNLELEKVAVTSALPGGKSGNGFLAYLPTWEKVGGGVAIAALVVGAVALMGAGDSTTTETTQVAVGGGGGGGSGGPGQEDSAPGPVEQPTPEVVDLALGDDHPPFSQDWTDPITRMRVPGASVTLACASFDGLAAGSIVTFHWSGAGGAFTANGVVGPNGRAIAAGGIRAFGPEQLTGIEARTSATGAPVSLDIPSGTDAALDVTSTEKQCDVGALSGGSVPGSTPKPGPAPDSGPATQTKTVTTQNTDSQPFPAVGGLALAAAVLGGLVLDDERRKWQYFQAPGLVHPDFSGRDPGPARVWGLGSEQNIDQAAQTLHEGWAEYGGGSGTKSDYDVGPLKPSFPGKKLPEPKPGEQPSGDDTDVDKPTLPPAEDLSPKPYRPPPDVM